MHLPVILSETAIETFEAIRDQILHRLGTKTAKDFEKNTIKILEVLSKAPFMFKEAEFDPNIRKGLVKKVSSFFYEVKSDRIDILFFWDNRQEPM